MSALHHSLFGKPERIEKRFGQIYQGMLQFFVAAGYAVSCGGTRMVVYDRSPKAGFSLETMVAVTSNFVREVWGLDIAQFPIKGEKAVALELRMPKPKRKK